MRLPLFNVFEYPRHPQLYQTLKSLGPAKSWDMMNNLAGIDKPLFEDFHRKYETADSFENLQSKAKNFMDLAPALSNKNTRLMSEQLASYGLKMQLESTFMLLWLDNKKILFNDVLEVDGHKHLSAAKVLGRGVLMLPLHIGPSYASFPLIAHDITTQCAYNRMNFDEIKEVAFPQLPIQGFQLGTISIIRKALEVLRSGNAFALFPEFDPRGVNDHHEPVSFWEPQ